MRFVRALLPVLVMNALALPLGGCDPLPPFDPSENGFGFANYGNQNSPTNLTAQTMRRIFGDGVCAAPPSGDDCILTGPARNWMEQQNAAMAVGHCEGMAVLSERFYLGTSSPSDFGASRAVDLQLTPELGSEIARWWSLQSVREVNGSFLKLEPVEALERLQASFDGTADEHYTIAFFTRQMHGGHAVTPYAIREDGDVTRIMIYDNNYPMQERSIEVSRAANTWTYNGGQNPMDLGHAYDGDATTKTLWLLPQSTQNLDRFPCPFCGSIEMVASARTVSTLGSASTLITDTDGHRLGRVDGEIVNEIPGAEVAPLLTGPLDDSTDPTYELPAGMGDLTMTLTGNEDMVMPEGALSMTGAGYYLGVEEIALAPGQSDQLTFGGDRPLVTYITERMTTPVVVLAVETETAGWIIALRAHGEAAGQAISAALNLNEQNVGFAFTSNDDDETVEFDFALIRLGEEGELTFEHEGVSVPNRSQLTLEYGAFDADGMTLPLAIDIDGDGVADDMVNLVDVDE